VLGVAAACVVPTAVRAEPHSEPIEAYRVNDGGQGQGEALEDDNELTRLAGDVGPPSHRFILELGVNTSLVGIEHQLGVYLGPEITAGLMLDHLEVLLQVGADIAVLERTQASNMAWLIRNDLLIGTNIALGHHVRIHIRAGPRILVLLGYGGVVSLGVSFNPRRRLLVSMHLKSSVGAQHLYREVGDDEVLDERHLAWGLSFDVAVAYWM